MKTTLVIMAAGIGSRFGTGIKQLAKVDDYGHIIMDYSVHDAIEAGFNKIIFVIRKDIEKEFREIIGDRIEEQCGAQIAYAFQDINDIPGEVPAGRTKPWGTCHAVLAARNLIDTPFCVINADDYYGKEGFRLIHDEIVNGSTCMAGFILKNTLSDNGGVTRGICQMDEESFLTKVIETSNIVKTQDGAEAAGNKLDPNCLCSMNMWGFNADFVHTLEEGLKTFLAKDMPKNSLKAEFLLPSFVEELLEQNQINVKVCKTHDTWYGMTYKEDVEAVQQSFRGMLDEGKYRPELYSDCKS